MAGNHKLPELTYAYDALEPYIDEATMRLHHGKHHMGYVNGLNAAEKALEESRSTGDWKLISHWQRQIAFHGAGHFNHCLFWRNMCPASESTPATGTLLSQIEKDFGSLENLKAQFSAASKTVEGSGWGMLVWDTIGNQLQTVAVENHQKNFPITAIPVLVLDVWEHAYYLNFQNKRADYVDGWWNIVNWTNVGENFEAARKLEWPNPF